MKNRAYYNTKHEKYLIKFRMNVTKNYLSSHFTRWEALHIQHKSCDILIEKLYVINVMLEVTNNAFNN